MEDNRRLRKVEEVKGKHEVQSTKMSEAKTQHPETSIQNQVFSIQHQATFHLD